jgi:hypothetical protein
MIATNIATPMSIHANFIPAITMLNGIYLGREVDGEIVYAGKVEHGFTRDSERDILGRAESLFTGRQPLSQPKTSQREAIHS